MQIAATQLKAKLFLLTEQLRNAMAQVRHSCFTVSVLGLFDLGDDAPLPKSEEELAAEKIQQEKEAEEAAQKAMQGASSDMFLLSSKGADDNSNDVNKGIFTFSAFLTAQQKKRELLGDWLLDFTDDVRMIVRGACDSVLDDFLQANSIIADHKMTFMEKAALRTACRKLVKFVRLSDFIVQQTLLDLGVESAAKLLGWLQPEAILRSTKVKEPKKKKKKKKNRKVVDYDQDGHGIYEDGTTTEDEREDEEKEAKIQAELDAAGPHPCDVRLMLTANMIGNGDTTLQLNPLKRDVIDEILECITDAVRVLSIPESIMEHSDLAPYVQGANEEVDDGDEEGGGGGAGGVSLDQQVMWNPGFQASTNSIRDTLERNFDSLGSFLSVFDPFLQVFDVNETNLAGDISETYKDLDLDAMEAEIDKYKGQNTSFQNIPRLTDVGVIRLDTIDLRFMLIPSPIRCLESLQDLLPILIRSASEKLMNEAINKVKVLTKEIENVKEFITVRKYLSNCEKEWEFSVEQQDRVKRMTSLMQHQKWRVPDDILAHNKMLDRSVEELRSSIDVSTDQMEGETSKWIEYIGTSVPELRADIANLGDLLRNPIIADIDHDINTVIDAEIALRM